MVAPNSKINFTKATLDSLPLPKNNQRFTFKDERERGLIIRITTNGQKTFQLYKKHQGRPIRISLGQYPDMTIENARNACLQAKTELTKGKNPNVEKNKLRQEMTFKELFDLYMEGYSKLEKKSWLSDESMVNRLLSHWFNRRISDISQYEIKELHVKLRKNRGLYSANRSLARLRAIYNKAIEWGWNGANPTTGIKMFKEKSRDRYILPNEMPIFLEALAIESNETVRDFFYICLFTGARKSNVLQMRYEQIDWHNKTWRIPDTKNDEPLILPLTEKANELLMNRRKQSNSLWVFPNADNPQTYFQDPKRAWNRIRRTATLEIWKQQDSTIERLIATVQNRLRTVDNYGFTVAKLFATVQTEAEKQGIELPIGLMDIRLHDIRRTFGSYQALAGASLQIIGKSLGHKSVQSTQVYARLHNDPVKASMEKATDVMLGLGT